MSELTGSTQQLSRHDDRLIDIALQVLSPRWTSSLLIQLFCGKKRTTELLRSLPGLSAKTLSERLKRLQELGLVSRTVYPEVPPRVEYELTEQGAQLLDALLALKLLGQRCAVGQTPGGDGHE
jgi:DNA-binding HxlR family transcriptional regulator